MRPKYSISYIGAGVAIVATIVISGCGNNLPVANDNGGQAVTGSYAMSEGSYGAPTLGVIVNQNWQVIDIEVGSAAAQEGIQRGDIIQELADLKLSNTARLDQVLPTIRGKIAPGNPFRIVLVRQGQVMQINVQPKNRPIRPGQATPTAVPVDQLYF